MAKTKLAPNFGTLIRKRPTELIPIDQIHTADSPPADDFFINLYGDYLKGKICATVTRIHIDKILLGALKIIDDEGCIKLQDMPPSAESVYICKKIIYGGARPSLVLYPSKDGRLICCDDVQVALAYKALNIKLIPCTILGEFESVPEGGLVVRHFRANTAATLEKPLPCLEPASLPIYRDLYSGNIQKSIRKLKSTSRKIRLFHKHSVSHDTHWHHILLSVCERATRLLLASDVLIARGLVSEASLLARSLYELALTFHLDWLAPEFSGDFLQMVGMHGKQRLSKAIKDLESKIPENENATAYKDWIASQKRMGDLCTNVSKKASIAPIGTIHQSIYPKLSGVAHQDFSAYSAFAVNLDAPRRKGIEQISEKSIRNILALSAAAIFSKIHNDIGLGLTSDSAPE